MRVLSIIFVLFVCFAGTSLAQCTLTTAESPPLANIRLGMSPAEVNAALGGAATVKVKNDERYTHYRRYKKNKAKGALTGVKTFWVRFYKSRVYSVEMFYADNHQFGDLDNMVQRYSVAHNFPFANFKIEHGYAKAGCDGFSVKADFILDPHIEIVDTAVVEELNSK